MPQPSTSSSKPEPSQEHPLLDVAFSVMMLPGFLVSFFVFGFWKGTSLINNMAPGPLRFWIALALFTYGFFRGLKMMASGGKKSVWLRRISIAMAAAAMLLMAVGGYHEYRASQSVGSLIGYLFTTVVVGSAVGAFIWYLAMVAELGLIGTFVVAGYNLVNGQGLDIGSFWEAMLEMELVPLQEIPIVLAQFVIWFYARRIK